jgi:hypothetical protein
MTSILACLTFACPLLWLSQLTAVTEFDFRILDDDMKLQRCHKPETWTYPLADRPNGEAWLKFIEKTHGGFWK